MKPKKILFLFLVIIFIILVIALLLLIFSKSADSNVIREPFSKLEVYFCPEDMCKEKMMELIESSKDIKCAFYDLDLPELRERLKQKNADVIIEDSNKLEEFHTGFSAALMHNKFCVFDNEIVSTGSMNPTINDNYLNNNNLIIISSKTLAQNYLEEFYELKNNIYGQGNKIKNPIVYLGNTKIENYFCPEDNCKLHVLNALKTANSSIYFMTFSFTDEDIGNLLWNKQYLGLEVKGIFDEGQISDYSRYEDLKEFSIIDKNKYKLHHKVFIIDNEIVITGSFNPSANANERNDENVIIIHNKEIAQKYAEEFRKLFNYEETFPSKTTNLILYKVLYDAFDSDEGKEYVELKNIGSTKTNLDYYYLSDNKSTMRINGTLLPNQITTIKPKFSLKNTNGLLILKHNSESIDFVAWEGIWDLKSPAGKSIIRKSNAISKSAWQSE